MHIFLPGASGFVGERVLNDLLAAGYEVTALTHSERSRSELQRRHPALNAASGDVASENDILRAMPAEIDAVVYLPGLLREFPRQAITFRGVHVEGVRNTLAAAKRAGVRRWIQLSALGTQANSATEYFRTKFDAEQLVQASGLEWTILRPALIFDDEPRRQHNFVEEVAKAIRMAPFVPILGSGKYLLQPVSLEDVSQTILQSLSKPATIGKIFEMGGPEKMTYLGSFESSLKRWVQKSRQFQFHYGPSCPSPAFSVAFPGSRLPLTRSSCFAMGIMCAMLQRNGKYGRCSICP